MSPGFTQPTEETKLFSITRSVAVGASATEPAPASWAANPSYDASRARTPSVCGPSVLDRSWVRVPGTMVEKVPSEAAVTSWVPSTRPLASVTASVKVAGTPASARPTAAWVTVLIVPETRNREPRSTVADWPSNCAVSRRLPNVEVGPDGAGGAATAAGMVARPVARPATSAVVTAVVRRRRGRGTDMGILRTCGRTVVRRGCHPNEGRGCRVTK